MTSAQPIYFSEPVSPWRFCVAPMLDWTNRHCRFFLRQMSRHARLYAEMVTTGAILHCDSERFLRFDAAEHPVTLQLGGSDADALARCAPIGYDEINLKCGCPSDRVQGGRFGRGLEGIHRGEGLPCPPRLALPSQVRSPSAPGDSPFTGCRWRTHPKSAFISFQVWISVQAP